ncbi:hypothetical protein ACC719_35355 [Rhizobium ruizarguesonis]
MVNPADAEANGIAHGDLVLIGNSLGDRRRRGVLPVPR